MCKAKKRKLVQTVKGEKQTANGEKHKRQSENVLACNEESRYKVTCSGSWSIFVEILPRLQLYIVQEIKCQVENYEKFLLQEIVKILKLFYKYSIHPNIFGSTL